MMRACRCRVNPIRVLLTVPLRQARADGYNFFWGTNITLVSNLFLLKSVPCDADKDFTPVANIVDSSPNVLARIALLRNDKKDVGGCPRDQALQARSECGWRRAPGSVARRQERPQLPRLNGVIGASRRPGPVITRDVGAEPGRNDADDLSAIIQDRPAAVAASNWR